MAFRKRLIEAQMDRRLIERTIELAHSAQEFGPRALRAALDSSPLWGAVVHNLHVLARSQLLSTELEDTA